MTREYQAVAEIEVAGSSTDSLGLDNLLTQSESSSDPLTLNIALETQAKILQSDSLALQVIQDLGLEGTKDFKPTFNPIGWALGLISPKGVADPKGASLMDSPARRTGLLRAFASRLKVKPVAGTRLVDVSFMSSNPKTAANVVNALIAGLTTFSHESASDATQQSAQWLSGQMADVKKQAEDLQAKVVDLQKDAGVYSLDAADSDGKNQPYSLTLQQLQQGTEALTAAESTRIQKGGIYEMIKGKDAELLSELAGSSLNGASAGVMSSFTLIQSLRGQQATLESQIAADSSKYGPKYPKLADELASSEAIKQQIANEAQRIQERAANDYHIAQETEDNLRKSYEKDKADADRLNNKAIDYTIARQEATQAAQLYQTLFSRMKEAGVVQGLHSTNVTIIDAALPPSKPSKPAIPLYLGLSIFAGLALGSLAAFFLESVDNKVQLGKLSGDALPIPILAMLPLLGEQKGSLFAAPAKNKRLSNGVGAGTPGLAVIENPKTAFSEALRGLATSIQLSRGQDGKPPKVILVTSSVPGEGKSTISSNLATLLAQSGEKVLLIEGDMRQPSFAQWFGASAEPGNGLSTVLTDNGHRGSLPVGEISPVSGLHVLYAGPVPTSPWEMLGKGRMSSLLEKLRPNFDYIVIDSPPLLAVNDAVIIGHEADLTLLVLRDDMTTLRSVQRAIDILGADGESHVGLVINGISRESAGYESYAGYNGQGY